MDQIIIDLLIFSTMCALLSYVVKTLAKSSTKLPPGPRPVPIIGNLLSIGEKPHKSLAKLAGIYGPIMTIKLGTTTNIVISSPTLAKEILQTHDQNLSSRPVTDAVTGHDHQKFSLVWLHSSPEWKNLRKICAVNMFSTQRLNASQSLRRVEKLLDHVHDRCLSGKAVDIGRVAFTTTLNFLSSTFFSMDMADYDQNTFKYDLKGLVWIMMEISGSVNVSDLFPAVKLFDLLGLRRKGAVEIKKLLDIFDDIINHRMQFRASVKKGRHNDVLDALLDLTEDKSREFGFKDIKHLLLDLFIAGADTSSSTTEWAMAELLQNPTKMAKARNELIEVLGESKQIKESDIPNLPYLQLIVKEILRLHPPAPMLIPHNAEIDVEINGYTVPKDAKILVNAWAIGRDPSIWENPNSFIPERFSNIEIEFKGQDFELIPFGAGRRICPGMPLAVRIVPLMLASLLHSFDWKLEDGMKPADMDMDDKFGITLQKAVPLKLIPIKV